MPTNDKDKRIIRPDDPKAKDFDLPRPNPSRNTSGDLLGASPPVRGTPTVRAGSPAPNVTPDPLIESAGPRPTAGRIRERDLDTSGRDREPMKDKARETTDRALGKARDAAEQVKVRGRELANDASDTVQDGYRKVDEWVNQQVSTNPVGTVMGAFAAGYVISAGLPRWMTRSLARVGLPLAAAGYLARMLSEGRFDDLLPKGQVEDRHRRDRPESDLIVP